MKKKSTRTRKKMTSRRLKRLLISPELFPSMFVTGKRIMITAGIPYGTEFRGFAHDFERNCIAVYIEHPSFDPVDETKVIPEYGNIRGEFIP